MTSHEVSLCCTPPQRTLLSAFNMTLYLVSLTATCFFVSAASAQNVYPDNGWRPMSIEKVLEQRRDFIRTPNVHFEKLQIRPTVMNDFENKNFVKIVQLNEMTKKPVEDSKAVPVSENNEDDVNEYQELIKIIQPPHKQIITLDDTNTSFNQDKQTQQLRRPKKIKDSNIVIQYNNALINPRKINEKFKEMKDKETDSTETYEVKENIEEGTQKATDQNLHYHKAFIHPISKSAEISTKNNLTTNLLQILANYNIRTSDNLRNYDISLRQNSRNSYNPDVALVPLKFPIRYYNNANHLPVDPLIAVFLSNYGHYLPSLFGFHNGYSNLYGYLASNNIHNNKPFGSYKLFSDTDSFH